MPRFSVVVNGVEVVREWGWDRISSVKEELKRLGFRWDGASWRGRTRDLGVLARLRQLLELSQEEYVSILSTVAYDVSGGAVLVVGALPEELKSHVISSEGDVHLVSLSGFLRRFIAEGRGVGRVSTFEEFVEEGGERLRAVLRGVQTLGDVDAALKSAKELVLSSDKLRELFIRRRRWWTASVGLNYARVNFLASGLLKKLGEVKLRYNVVNKEGELEERDIKLVKVAREGSSHLLKFPVFVRGRVAEILEEFGYAVEYVGVEHPRVAYKRSFSLYPFQQEAVERWVSSGMRGTVVIPTGGGKTFIGLDAMYRAGVSALVLVVTRELALQWVERIRRHLGISPGMLGGGAREVREVTVAIYNSAVKYIEDLVGRFGLVIFDEAHHVPAETFKEVALGLDSPYRLALSATPEREDKNEHLIFESVGPIVYRASYRSMVEAGLVVPVEHYRVYIRLSEEEEAAYRTLPNDNVIVLRNTAAKSARKIEAALRIIAREVSLGSKVLVFTQFIDQAEELHRRIRELGISAELITSEEGNREISLRRFSSGVSRVVVTTTVLDEGVDVPDAEVAVVVSGTGSKRQMIQRVGRVVRAAPGKKVARVYELVARGTVEEALSEMRHFDDVIEETICRRVTEQDLDAILRKVAPLTTWLRRS
ncbi:DEAD/DEAH box helicase [Pyrobaculum neutrophilum]|uniref:Type III restriction protein res subunit n=1 Tax=Pyrobaculum neutrophilum (strain DSM 2338 / JCM 9278 / NBRC 100436 / V24Sta) TaxID=444157 RepID=B1YCU6_PYRNV|nr:DEAD/DEAH box helicase [Pyrobaculum neutrophilum]ACB39609.1 type III restriction protein res subunit [Pyrobaculum neutrophilum V24Sta]